MRPWSQSSEALSFWEETSIQVMGRDHGEAHPSLGQRQCSFLSQGRLLPSLLPGQSGSREGEQSPEDRKCGFS